MQGLITHLSKDERFLPKITVTGVFELHLEKHYECKSSSNKTIVTYNKVKPTHEITDSIKGTGDRLRGEIPIQGLETCNVSNWTYGDGVTVVPVIIEREGSQEYLNGLKYSGGNSRIYGRPKTRVVGSYPLHNQKREISSLPLKNLDNFKIAYDKMKSNPGNMSPGYDGQTIDSMSIVKIDKLQKEILDWSYKCKPTRRVNIPKANGKTRPLGIPCTMDKLLQIVLKDILEPELEKVFHPQSYAFRPKRSVHHALIEVQKMTGITWLIEGDIKGYFDNIDHQIMAKLLKDNINPDILIMNLIWKFFKAGYLDGKHLIKDSLAGLLTQGGILSPLLSNLYLTPFDRFVDSLKQKYEILPISVRNPEYRKIEWRIQNNRNKLKRTTVRTEEEIRTIKELIKTLGKQLRTKSSAIRVGTKIHYVRYADDWVIGVSGTKETAEKIREEVRIFLAEELKLELSMEKTKITHLGTNYAKFLGHYIKVQTLTQHVSSRRRSVETREVLNMRKSTGKPKILVPIDLLKDKLVEKGFAKPDGMPRSCNKFIFLPDHEIVQRYNSVLRGIMNYYNMAENRSKLSQAVYILEYSLAHTLAAKHRSSISKIFIKYGKPIKVKKGDKIINFDAPESLSAAYLNEKYMRVEKYDNKSEKGSDPFKSLRYDLRVYNNILDKPCIICDSEDNVEMHHLRHLKDTQDKGTLIKIMSKIRRKVVPLCRTCHNKVHAGKYDGLSLKEGRSLAQAQ